MKEEKLRDVLHELAMGYDPKEIAQARNVSLKKVLRIQKHGEAGLLLGLRDFETKKTIRRILRLAKNYKPKNIARSLSMDTRFVRDVISGKARKDVLRSILIMQEDIDDVLELSDDLKPKDIAECLAIDLYTISKIRNLDFSGLGHDGRTEFYTLYEDWFLEIDGFDFQCDADKVHELSQIPWKVDEETGQAYYEDKKRNVTLPQYLYMLKSNMVYKHIDFVDDNIYNCCIENLRRK